MDLGGLLGLIVLVLDVLAIIRTLSSAAAPVEKLLWVLVIVLLPVVGLLLWWFLGPRAAVG